MRQMTFKETSCGVIVGVAVAVNWLQVGSNFVAKEREINTFETPVVIMYFQFHVKNRFKSYINSFGGSIYTTNCKYVRLRCKFNFYTA